MDHARAADHLGMTEMEKLNIGDVQVLWMKSAANPIIYPQTQTAQICLLRTSVVVSSMQIMEEHRLVYPGITG
jgi:hypothetical protein